jgi:hypothetical protein
MCYGPEIEATIKWGVKLAVLVLDELEHYRRVRISLFCPKELFDSVIAERLALAILEVLHVESAGLVCLNGPVAAGGRQLFIDGQGLGECEGEVRVRIARGLRARIEVVGHGETTNPVAEDRTGLEHVCAARRPIYNRYGLLRTLKSDHVLFVYGFDPAAEEPGGGQAVHLESDALIQLHPFLESGQEGPIVTTVTEALEIVLCDARGGWRGLQKALLRGGWL